MAPNTAVAFLALGIALILLQSRKRLHVLTVGLATTLSSLITLQLLIGYAYGARGFRGLAHFSPMALPTALNFALLTCAVIATRRNHWPMSLLCSDITGAASARLLLPVAVTVPFLGAHDERSSDAH